MNVFHNLKDDIATAYPDIYSVRLSTVFTFVGSRMRDQRVTMTYFDRGLKDSSDTYKKHDIKRADRLIGNPYLQSERLYFYEFMTEQLVGHNPHPLVIVD